MKKIIGIIVFLASGIFMCIGGFVNNWIVVCIGAVCSSIFGSLVSWIIEEIDTHNQGVRLWFQQLLYRKKEVRLSFAYLFRIEIDGKYLLVKGKRLSKQFQPVGGVYKFYSEAKPTLEKFKYRVDTQMGNIDETDDLRIFIKGRYLLQFMDWFLSMKDREYDPYREFSEELLDTKLLPLHEFKSIRYRKIGVHNDGITYSKYLNCNEVVYADVFEITLTDRQKQAVRKAINDNPDLICLATADELRKECFNGIEKNIGNNAKWLLGD